MPGARKLGMMRKFLAVVTREWAAQRNVLLPAPLLAAAAWILRGFGDSADDRMAIATVTSAALAALLIVVVSWFLGATMIASDVAERRFAFYLSRPLGAGTLWFGKLFANSVLVMVAGAAGGIFAIARWPWWSAAALALVPVLIALAHALSVTVRAGGLRLLLDAFLLVILAGVALLILHEFSVHRSFYAGVAMASLTIAALAVGLLTAGAFANRHAAAGIDRYDRAQHATFWRCVFLLVLSLDTTYWIYLDGVPARGGSFIGYQPCAGWVAITRATPARLDWFRTELREDGTNRRVELGARFLAVQQVVESPVRHDLFVLGFVRQSSTDDAAEVVRVLRRPWARTKLLAYGVESIQGISPDGSLLAVTMRGGGGVELIDAETGDVIRELRDAFAARFMTRALLRVVELRQDELWLRELDLAHRRETARILCRGTATRHTNQTVVNATATRFIVADGTRFEVFDERGRLLNIFAGHSSAFSWPDLLGDGRMVIPADADGRDVIRLVDRDGAQLRDYPVPKPVSFISQPLPGVLLAARDSGQAFLLNLNDGRVQRVPDVSPLAWPRGGPLIRGYPATLAERGAAIVSINARSGEVTLVERGMRPMREMWSTLY